MRHPHPELLQFAERALAHEAMSSPPNHRTPIERACDALQQTLNRMIGLRGFHAVLGRAIFLRRIEYPWLAPVRVGNGDGCALLGVAESMKAAGAEASAGFASIIATTIALLASFIGEGLTIRVLHETWPDVPFENNLFPEGSMYE
jgi:hypothetical protein